MIDKKSGNVLFIVADDLRADCLQLVINGQAVMPNLREFMEDAVTFRRHYTVTCPCGPVPGQSPDRSLCDESPVRGAMVHRCAPTFQTSRSKHENRVTRPLLFGFTDTSYDPRFLHPNDPASQEQRKPRCRGLRKSWPCSWDTTALRGRRI